MMIKAYIGLGANLGAPRETVRLAIARLACMAQTRLLSASSLYSSTPIESSGDDYVNAVAAIETGLSADALLQALQTIEQDFGRERPYRNAPRTLDLDLLLYGETIIASSHLQVPHPRMTTRAFVLRPLLQIAPAIVIPGHGAASDWMVSVADQGITELFGD